MHKLVILIEPVEDEAAFEAAWPEFLRQAEAMPGLIREASSRVDFFLAGSQPVSHMHELFFDSLEDAQAAMASPQGRTAGRVLQSMTAGHITLFFAHHLEDDLAHIRQYQGGQEQAGASQDSPS